MKTPPFYGIEFNDDCNPTNVLAKTPPLEDTAGGTDVGGDIPLIAVLA